MSGGFNLPVGLCNASSIGADAANTRGTAVVAGALAYGSYTQLVASSAVDTQFIVIGIVTNASANSGFGGSVRIAVGAAASEVAIISDLPVTAPSGGYYNSTFAFPIEILAGTRISAAASGNAATDTFYVNASLYDGGFPSGSFSGVDSLGAFSNGARGTQVTSGAANTKGSYTQLIASTSRDYLALGFTLCLYTGGNLGIDRILLDIAVGGAGSEQIIIPDWFISINKEWAVFQSIGCLPIEIPSGTRISARIASPTSTFNVGIIAYGLYE